MEKPENDLRGDRGNKYGIDVPMLEIVLDSGNDKERVRAEIERRIAAGNESARDMKLIMTTMGMW